jgi:integrase
MARSWLLCSDFLYLFREAPCGRRAALCQMQPQALARGMRPTGRSPRGARPRHSEPLSRDCDTPEPTLGNSNRRVLTTFHHRNVSGATVQEVLRPRQLDEDAFVFSYGPDHRRPCSPSGVTHRYERMVRKLAIRTRLHSMRHYSATELLSSGVDLRTSAGRLGHGSGGAITLRVYAAWVAQADQEAARTLASRLPLPRRGGAAPGEKS